jgi:peroxiredoxin
MSSCRSLAGAALVLACLAPTAYAETAPPLPESVQAIVTRFQLDKVKDLSFRDVAGQRITAEEFARLQKEDKPFTVAKRAGADKELVAVISITTLEAIRANTPPPEKIQAGQQFPAFALAKLGGGKVDNAALRGRYSLINFYFAQCAPCVKEIPEMNALSKARPDLNLVGVTFDSAEDTRKFVAEFKFDWMLLPESKKLIDELGVRTYPSFVLLDPEGKVVAIARHHQIVKEHKSVTAWIARIAPPPV